MANDFIKLSPLMALGVVAAVLAAGAGGCAYLMWKDHNPKTEHAMQVAMVVCAISGVVALACFWLTRNRWLGRDEDY